MKAGTTNTLHGYEHLYRTQLVIHGGDKIYEGGDSSRQEHYYISSETAYRGNDRLLQSWAIFRTLRWTS
ncbi:hypothetical protein AC578_6317 [Pseudocercospora eumusae]|uniref:Uncharacterized protein n=1 Tax=Pseudocercospora eumusae TaxID=321146 RepID=A0A139H2A5_9PEZI|nr:hypothetical protein AC578_6317 [Pseudocercospora eumusae]